jgi:chromosome segregation ATPase
VIRGIIATAIIVAAVNLASLACAHAQAQSEADRLRDALRTATAQTRQLEDERTALQAKLADADRQRAAAKAEVDAAHAEVRQVRKEQREAIDEFNKRLAERDDVLEKWKAAYDEAATVARAKDAERAKFESEANAYKASTTSCTTKNGQLITACRELLHRYQSVTIGDTIVAHEPALGLRRVEIQNAIQDTRDKILDQKFDQKAVP